MSVCRLEILYIFTQLIPKHELRKLLGINEIENF